MNDVQTGSIKKNIGDKELQKFAMALIRWVFIPDNWAAFSFLPMK